MKSFVERESFCETTFASCGPYWHAYTNGKTTSLIFMRSEDFTFAMNVIAQAAAAFPNVKVIAFEVMGNHLHFVLSGNEADIQAFWRFIRKRLSRNFGPLRDIPLQLKQIDSLQSMRNHIVYVHRNGYVVDPDHTPFSYPWGSGRYYFQDIPCFISCAHIKTDARRVMFRGRAPQLPDDWMIMDAYVCPSSFCAIKFGMAMFRDAHHYFSLISKNVEAYSGIAVELDDTEFLTDSELFIQVSKILPNAYDTDRISSLTKAQRLDLAKKLHYDYRSSNGQISRLLGLTVYEVDSMFPLSRK